MKATDVPAGGVTINFHENNILTLIYPWGSKVTEALDDAIINNAQKFVASGAATDDTTDKLQKLQKAATMIQQLQKG